jgi:hypothetical protein
LAGAVAWAGGAVWPNGADTGDVTGLAAGAAAGPAGTVNGFLQMGQLICVPMYPVSHEIFWPHAGQANLKSPIRLFAKLLVKVLHPVSRLGKDNQTNGLPCRWRRCGAPGAGGSSLANTWYSIYRRPALPNVQSKPKNPVTSPFGPSCKSQSAPNSPRHCRRHPENVSFPESGSVRLMQLNFGSLNAT